MKTYLYENSQKWEQNKMSLPPGDVQNEFVSELIEHRKIIDDKISELVKLRKEFSDKIILKCTHPLERRAINSWDITDTLGNNGYDELTLICRDCGQTLRKVRNWCNL